MEAADILNGLRDVEGIIGSFVVGASGALVARDLPSMFDDDTLRAAAPRLVRLRDGIASDGADPSALVLRYSEHKLHLRPAGSGLLCVLTESNVNAPALRVGMKLVARRVAPLAEQRPQVESRSFSPPPATQRSVPPVPPPMPASVPAPPAAPIPQGVKAGVNEMIYRGNKVKR